jgi:protein TonB
VEFIVITGSDDLLEQIGQVLDGDCTVRHADTPSAAHQFIRPARPCVVLLDARGHDQLAAVIESVQSLDGTSVVVVFSPAEESAGVSRSVRGSATFAVLPIPIEVAQTHAILDGAREEALARLALITSPALPPEVLPAAEPSRLALAEAALTEAVAMAATATGAPVRPASSSIVIEPSTPTSGGGKSRGLWIGLGVILIGVVIAAGVFLRGSEAPHAATATEAPAKRTPAPTVKAAEPSPQPVTQGATTARPAMEQTATPADVQDGSIDDLLDRARSAMLERRYTDPEGDNALLYFRSVLAQAPGNDEAHEGLQRIAAVLDVRLQGALAQRKFDDASHTIAQLKLIRADDASLLQLRARLANAQIEAALGVGNAERAAQLLRQSTQTGELPAADAARWRDEIGRRQSDSRAPLYAQLVSTRIREGKLLEPANDSAKLYLTALRNLPADPKNLAAAANDELQQAFLAKAQDAAAQSQRADMEHWLNEARALGASPTRVAAVMRSAPPVIAARPTPVEDARPIASPARASEPPPTATVDTSRRTVMAAPLPAPTQPKPAVANEFKRTHFVAPVYPADALRKKLSGEVRVQITVGIDGKVKDATVLGANPPGVFDQAALDAVRKWRYKPIEVDGETVGASFKTTIIFQPERTRTP